MIVTGGVVTVFGGNFAGVTDGEAAWIIRSATLLANERKWERNKIIFSPYSEHRNCAISTSQFHWTAAFPRVWSWVARQQVLPKPHISEHSVSSWRVNAPTKRESVSTNSCHSTLQPSIRHQIFLLLSLYDSPQHNSMPPFRHFNDSTKGPQGIILQGLKLLFLIFFFLLLGRGGHFERVGRWFLLRVP